jgi:hypothetical protein
MDANGILSVSAKTCFRKTAIGSAVGRITKKLTDGPEARQFAKDQRIREATGAESHPGINRLFPGYSDLGWLLDGADQ